MAGRGHGGKSAGGVRGRGGTSAGGVRVYNGAREPSSAAVNQASNGAREPSSAAVNHASNVSAEDTTIASCFSTTAGCFSTTADWFSPTAGWFSTTAGWFSTTAGWFSTTAEENPIPNPAEQDYQALLDVLLALPGRQHLPVLSVDPIPGVETLWFNRHKGKISRVISGIFRRKFDGPYYSWKVTPRPIQERYFRIFARKFYWDTGITELVREGFLKIAKKRMKGIVSQAKSSGKQPVWITSAELWAEMCDHWNEPDVMERSSNASQCRNSDRGGLGVHKHLAGQKSYVQVHQEMEEELGRPVSFAEVFMKTHTRADGSFVDQKAKQVAETYEKTLEERLCEVDDDGPENSVNSSERSTHRTLSIDEKNDIFLKVTP
ncbi:PREDICTED: uncharacterized protein LOC109126349 [Camelina sativa]|uniref:Uncharacterized protein LOC109126349 n=1 Tax=Camelina sativa TaxID=90675 RepID=A0ABM1QF66_CAMSA|nr:PREDICTED: uncharacterized protein LOC109126349 [Camelina sativa]